MRTLFAASCLFLCALVTAPAHAQCMLANPSFEFPGSGTLFGGWNEFGVISVTTNAPHGAQAARVTGPNTGPWGLSGYWQPQDTAPGETWRAAVCVWHTASNPITGQSTGILNIEWRDAAGQLISYETHTVADTSTPLDEIQFVTIESGPAPPATVSTRIMLGALQAPGEPAHDVYFDQAIFENLGPPTPEDLQWGDFPGGRGINFSGRPWRVKGPGFYGPGPNLFSNADSAVWVDPDGRLHMTIQQIANNWQSTEITLEDALGYGDYVFTTRGELDLLHENVVLGMFLWQYGPCFLPQNSWWNPYNEVDVEISRWGIPANDVAQFVVQPWDWPGNINRFAPAYAPGEVVSYAFRWLPDQVKYRAWRGGPQDEAPGTTIHTWTYTGPHVPRPDQPRVHINLWQFNGSPTTRQEVVFDAFTFTQDCIAPHCTPPIVDVPGPAVTTLLPLLPPHPNPLGATTTIRYALPGDRHVDLAVFDVSGRRIRTLVSGWRLAGSYEAVWNGRGDDAARLAPGIYLVRLAVGDIFETRRVVLLK